MYEYKFVSIRLSFFFGKAKEDYHLLIEEHARQGWRLVQIFAPATAGLGTASYFEIIFERSKSGLT